MKKNVLKKSLKFQLHRETLRALEEPQLLAAVVGGSPTGITGSPSPSPCFNRVTCTC